MLEKESIATKTRRSTKPHTAFTDLLHLRVFASLWRDLSGGSVSQTAPLGIEDARDAN
jgi:hypothetical protein